MEWRKRLLLLFTPFLALGVFLLREEKPQLEQRSPARKIASNPGKNKALKSRREPGAQRSLQPGILKNSLLRNRIPQSVESTFEKDPSVSISRGYELIKDVAAVPKERYSPAMGELIQQSDLFTYFRTGEHHAYIPVAISKQTNVLYPVSSILHIKGATQSIRATLLARGYTQYYYHEQLKFLSLESKTGELLKTYTELKDDGYDVQLEVLKPTHKSR